jgi:hypothetical protein
MGKVALARVEDILQKDLGYYRFVAIFTWPPEADEVARQRFGQFLGQYNKTFFEQSEQSLEETDVIPQSAYSLTGARTVLVIGITKSAPGLYSFCSSIIFNANIHVNFYHAMDYDEARKMFPALEH